MRARLLELPCDEVTLGLARQARNVAREGHCHAAEMLVERIRERDARYAAGLVAAPALAGCR